jgi:hypothetical protein
MHKGQREEAGNTALEKQNFLGTPSTWYKRQFVSIVGASLWASG